LGDRVARRFLGEVRDGLFGDSICFLISGGSHIDAETLAFFNGIGYHLANGYGMTEIGITSVDPSSSRRALNRGAVGIPFGTTEYRISDEGELMVRGLNTASRIAAGNQVTVIDHAAWFATGDLAEVQEGRYYIKGRRDDLLIGADGENLNPIMVESHVKIPGVDRVCLYNDREGRTVLLASVQGCYSAPALQRIRKEISDALTALKLERTVTRVLFTHEPLLRNGEIKLSRKRIAKAVESGSLAVFEPEEIEHRVAELLSELETGVRECFAAALSRPAQEIGLDQHFFSELGGTSLDYFALQGEIKSRLGVDIDYTQSKELFTVRDFTAYIQSH
jgi:long-subunit acyl-CoA synthetase (AMP-forming)